ncbi:MAG: lysophospholipid acyltransferase family protein [Thermaurantiacus sp.]
MRQFAPARGIAGALATTGALLPAWAALRAVHPPTSERVPRRYFRGLLRALRVSAHIHGTPDSGGVLFVANHISWMDIPVLGAQVHAAFVAKREVADMGLVGRFADIGQTIYVDRSQRHRSSEQAGAIARRLATGSNVILFPEGTSGDGVRVLPFKSSLFASATHGGLAGLRVQPVSLAYTEINGLPVTRNRLLELAWIGDMDLAPHLFEMMRLGRIRADIQFHAPVEAGDFPDRKALARHCEREVAMGYARLTGRAD